MTRQRGPTWNQLYIWTLELAFFRMSSVAGTTQAYDVHTTSHWPHGLHLVAEAGWMNGHSESCLNSVRQRRLVVSNVKLRMVFIHHHETTASVKLARKSATTIQQALSRAFLALTPSATEWKGR